VQSLDSQANNLTNSIPFVVDMSEKKEQWLKVSDVAKQLSVSTVTIHRLVQRGELIGHKIGKLLKFRPEEIDDYIKRTRTDQK